MSSIIKSSNAQTKDLDRTIEIKRIEQRLIHQEKWTPESRLENSEREAKSILVEAERSYEEMTAKMEQERRDHEAFLEKSKEEWNAQVILEREEAKKDGFNEGYQAGLLEGQKAYDRLLEQARETVERSKQDYEQQIASAEPVIIELAVKMARKLVGDILLEDKEGWTAILKGLMNEVRDFPEVNLYVHPNRYEATQNAKQEIQNVLMHTAVLYIYPDEKLDENACVVEFPFGRIEAGMDSQLSELKEKLIEEIGEQNVEHI
ncbi:flagellar assembly protein FliH [Fictibacillus terranigra]|uniref:Flagellar assembly protein FliH n=1 Tax=Fictibacillus terranigra TaxID=3058424 RepID=A0ABT8E694_9BACL|nr:flagellar assembly protein FliH [Fictibacillus sp. CENA-BCM004]MDN4073439.1 flagellar assembly protein FliH [Fictibacillus sp. CENA-BCM004]